jgi:hypothetical protein
LWRQGLSLEEELRKRICSRCDFYKEGESLECYAFKLSKRLVREGRLRLEEL